MCTATTTMRSPGEGSSSSTFLPWNTKRMIKATTTAMTYPHHARTQETPVESICKPCGRCHHRVYNRAGQKEGYARGQRDALAQKSPDHRNNSAITDREDHTKTSSNENSGVIFVPSVRGSPYPGKRMPLSNLQPGSRSA